MNISGQIIEVLDSILEKFGIAVDWSQQNVLPYLQELSQKYIKHELTTSIVSAVLFLFILIILSKFVVKSCKILKDGNNYYFDEEVLTIILIILSISIVGFMIGLIYQIYDIIACYTFPEKIIIDLLTRTLKNSK